MAKSQHILLKPHRNKHPTKPKPNCRVFEQPIRLPNHQAERKKQALDMRSSCCRWWNTQLSHEKNLPTFHYTGWLMGILKMAYYNPYITVARGWWNTQLSVESKKIKQRIPTNWVVFSVWPPHVSLQWPYHHYARLETIWKIQVCLRGRTQHTRRFSK